MASVNTFNSPHRLTSKPEDLADGWSPRQLLRARRHIQTKPGRSLAPRLRSGVEGAQHRDAARQAAPHKSQSAAPGLACSPTPLSLWLPGRSRSSALSFGQCGKPGSGRNGTTARDLRLRRYLSAAPLLLCTAG
ncbi:unnamed protein product [Amoebophrya sp. A120]|nr:unnamed protein product [Amoebophrya sp. A120]|eukprot:GSA120T00008501001.1